MGISARRNVRTWGLVRNSQALAAPLPFSIYSDSYDDRCYVRGLAKQGFCGLLSMPELRTASSLEELYRRIEVVLFAPQSLMDSWQTKLPAWLQLNQQKADAGEMMPEHEQATRVIKRLFEMRMSLIPYLYSSYNEYYLHGTPPVRALVMDWPADAKTHAIDDQFLVGPSLLVAPIFTGQASRRVYLPAGRWCDFWTHAHIEGGKEIEVSKPWEQIPLYVKDNALLPLALPVEHVAPDTQFELTVNVFGGKPSTFTLFEDDGTSCDFEHGPQNRIVLRWNGKDGSTESTGGYAGPSRYRIAAWKVVANPQHGGN